MTSSRLEWIKVLPPIWLCSGNRHSRDECSTCTDTGHRHNGSDRPAHRQYQPIRLAWLHGHRNHRNGRTHHHHPDGRRYAGTDPPLTAEWTILSEKLTKHVNSKRGAELCIAALVSIAKFLYSQQYDSHHHSGTIGQRHRYPLQGGQTQECKYPGYFLVCHPGYHPLRSANADCRQAGFPFSSEHHRILVLSGSYRSICSAEHFFRDIPNRYS